MNVKPFYPLLFLCCFQYQQLFCQIIENHFTHYTTKDGLSDGVILDINQDRQGFLWLATNNGLCRFDGQTFKNFRYVPGDTTSLCENNIKSIFIDHEGKLWCVSYDWLYLYHPEGGWFEHFNIEGFNAEHICEEDSGQLIIATSLKGLYKFDIKQRKFYRFDHEGVPNDGYYYYKKDEDGIEWMSQRKNLIRYDPGTKKVQFVFPSLGPVVILPDGFLLAGTFDQGLVLINRRTNTMKQFLPDKNNPNSLIHTSITCLYRLNDSIVLAGTNEGMSVFNWRTEHFTNISPETTNPASLSEANLRVNAIFYDREGILWLGGQHLEKQDFKNFDIKIIPSYGKDHNEKPFYNYSSIYRCADGNFLLGSYGGMSIYDIATEQLIKFENKQFNPEKNEHYKLIDCIQDDGHGNIWCINWPHFCSFHIKGDRAIDVHEHTFPFPFRLGDMTIDKKGHVLIGTIRKGMLKFDPSDSSYTVFDSSSSSPARLTNLNVASVCAARDGSIWLGTQKGVNKIERDGITVKRFGPNGKRNTFLHDFQVRDIKENSHGMIWFTTNEDGLGMINPANDSLSFLSIAGGLPTSWYDQICIDDSDNLWALSRMGILRINTLTLQSQLYTDREGFPLPDDIINIHYSKFNRKLYLLTKYAIFEINISQSRYKPLIPQTLITAFSVFDNEKPLPQTNTVNLKYNENFINIQFAALLFHSNDQIKYAYKMTGIDEDWVYCNYKRNASYTNLPPGHYVFQVKSQSPEGVWSNTPTLLNIFIKPPFWLTWWFYLLEAAVASVIIIWIVRLYTARKLAKQKIEFEKQRAVSTERTRIASDMHDELGAGLTSISLLSEVANQKIKQNISAHTEIQKIVRSADLLSKNLREIIWTMNTRNDKLEYFIIYVRTYSVEYFDDTAIKFQFNRPTVIPELTISGELRRNIFLCVKEALNNIIKHSQATEASLTFEITGSIITIIIKDNGTGIDATKMNKFGNGLNTMKERLKKFESDMQIETGNGTKVVFTINITSI